MAFTVGMKCVCVSAPTGGYGNEIDPCPGAIYTVRAFDTDRKNLGLLLVEIKNVPQLYSCPSGIRFVEVSFSAFRFRPLVSRKTEISFTAGADPKSESWDNRVKVPSPFDYVEEEMK